MELNRTLSRLKNSVEDALSPIIKKGTNLSPSDLENATKAVCLIEAVKRIESMPQSENGYSERDDFNRVYHSNNMSSRYQGSGEHSYQYDNPYYGENSRRYYDGHSKNNYSGHSIRDRMISRLEEMFDEAQTEHERQTIQEWIDRVNRS